MKHSLTSLLKRTSLKGGCRLWKGPLNSGGYPYVYDSRTFVERSYRNGVVGVRALVWKLAHDDTPPPPGKHVYMKVCNERTCIEPSHMAAGNRAEIAQHASEHGAFKSLRRRVANIATARKNAKLTFAKAEDVRLAVGESTAVTAERHNISRALVNQIRRGERWRPEGLIGSSVFNHGVSP